MKPRKPPFHVSALHLVPLLTSKISAAHMRPKRKRPLSPGELVEGSRLGTDSHAEATCYGRHARITRIHEGLTNNVSPFHDGYDPISNVQTADACFAFDAADGQLYILHHHYGLDFSATMEHSILCTNQSRSSGIIVDDVPTCFDARGEATHSIHFPNQGISLPLRLHNAVSYLHVRYPTDDDMENGTHINLSDPDIPWDPTLFTYSNGRQVSAFNNMSEDEECEVNVPQSILDQWANHLSIGAVSHSTHSDMTAERLADLWHISIENAARTLKCVDMHRIRVIKGKIHKRFKTRVHQKRYRQLGGYLSMFASDTFKSNVTSIRGNNYIQLFCNKANYTVSYPMKSKEHAHHALDRFLHEVGVPSEMLTDGAKELVVAEWGKTCQRHKIYQVTTEPHSPWQNPAEKNGGLVKRKVKHLMQSTNTPIVCWDYCWEYASAIRSHVAVNNVLLDDVTPYEKVHGYTPDVSEYTMFKWYDWVWFHDPDSPEKMSLGRWLGPAHNIGQGLAHYVLADTGKVRCRSTVKEVSKSERNTAEFQERAKLYAQSVDGLIGNFSQSTLNKTEAKSDAPYESLFGPDSLDDEDIDPQEYDEFGNPVSIPNVDEPLDDSAFMENDDNIVGLKIPIERGGEVLEGTVKSRKRRPDGSLVGTANENIVLDSRVYEVEFPDGSYGDYATNVLIENLYAHVDDEGYHHALLKGIVDHKYDESAVKIQDGKYVDSHGATRMKITTKGWHLKTEWEDGTMSWIPLSTLKESNPIETAQYAKSRGLMKEPAFAWWAPHVLKKAHRIVKAAKHRKVRKKIKFGVVIPDSVEEAYALDKENGNDFWAKSIDKEIKNVKVAFKVLEEGEKPPPGSKHIPYHIIFDVKFDLTRKSRLVAGGHRNKDIPAYVTYSSVATRDSVRLAFLIAALNNLKIMSADIGNAYLNAPSRERVHVTLGPELFGKEHEGKTALIVRALYGCKSAGAAWRHHFSTFIRDDLGFTPTMADPDVYRKPKLDSEGKEYYAYLVLYVDDVLAIEEDPQATMDQIENVFRLKEGIGKPKMYLGTDIREWSTQHVDGSNGNCWAIGSESYLKEAVRVAESNMSKLGLEYSSSRREGRDTPFKDPNYRPELDSTDPCTEEETTLYQNLIGMLRWTCELGRIDILHETSILSQYLAMPRKGHLQEAINIFYYLKHHNRSWMVMDPRKFNVDWTPSKPDDVHPEIRAQAMKEIYPDAVDVLPHNMPPPRGESVNISVFVDADHAGNQVTRRSHTGIIIMVNMAPIIWYSKRQNTVETSTFGSEYVALKIAIELVEALMYKLRMFGVKIDGKPRIFCDNQSVVTSSSSPQTVLKKKHCSVAYHKIREAVAAGKALIYYEKSESNLADLLTKCLSARKRRPLIQALLS